MIQSSEQPETSWSDDPARRLVHVADLRRRLGQRRTEEIEVVLARTEVIGSRTVRRPVTGSITIESIERGVSATGRVRFEWEGDCRRCLEAVRGDIEIDIDEIFQVNAPEDSEIIDFDGETIDLLPIIRDAVVLSLPLAPLCRTDCAGPDPDRYPASTVEQATAVEVESDEGARDPRWAALDQLDVGPDAESGVDPAGGRGRAGR